MALYSRPFESSGRQTLQRTVVLAGLIVAVVAAAYWPSRHAAFVFDDLTFGSTTPGVVTPEPSALGLLAAGVAGVLAFARRRARGRASC